MDPRACPRIGAQPARPLRDVNGDACVSTSRRNRVAERKQPGSATPGSGGAFRPMGPALVPSRRRACEQNPATRRHNYIGFVKPPVAGTAGQPDCPDSKEGRKAVLLHHRCVAQGIARCGSKASGGILRHHAACDAPFRAERALHSRTIEEVQKRGQVARLKVSSPLRKVSTSLTLGGRPSGAGACQDSGARSKSTCEPDASNPQRARPEACTAQTFTKRCRGSPHFQALKGHTAVVLMDAGAPFAKALRCLGLVVHSCPLETLRKPQARDRISRLCRESSFVVYATLPFDLYRWSFGRERLTRKTLVRHFLQNKREVPYRRSHFCLGGNVVAVSQLAVSASNVCGQCKV